MRDFSFADMAKMDTSKIVPMLILKRLFTYADNTTITYWLHYRAEVSECGMFVTAILGAHNPTQNQRPKFLDKPDQTSECLLLKNEERILSNKFYHLCHTYPSLLNLCSSWCV